MGFSTVLTLASGRRWRWSGDTTTLGGKSDRSRRARVSGVGARDEEEEDERRVAEEGRMEREAEFEELG